MLLPDSKASQFHVGGLAGKEGVPMIWYILGTLAICALVMLFLVAGATALFGATVTVVKSTIESFDEE